MQWKPIDIEDKELLTSFLLRNLLIQKGSMVGIITLNY